MSLDPRAIALQGIGYAPAFVARQGLVPEEAVVARRSSLDLAGGATGRGYLSKSDFLRLYGPHLEVRPHEAARPSAEASARRVRRRRADDEDVQLLGRATGLLQ